MAVCNAAVTIIADLLDTDLSADAIKLKRHSSPPAEIAVARVLQKKAGRDTALRQMFREHRAALIRNTKLERTSLSTDLEEAGFVQFYPFLPHLIDLSVAILDGLHARVDTTGDGAGADRAILDLCFEMLVSPETRFADEPAGALVSLDKIYNLLEESVPVEKRDDIRLNSARCAADDISDLPARVLKVISLLELATTKVPRTANNIAALLVRHVAEPPPLAGVTAVLDRMRRAQILHRAADGWTICGENELQRIIISLEGLRQVIGRVNPRPSGWHNNVIQTGKKYVARLLRWYTGPFEQFNAGLTRALDEIAGTLDHLSAELVLLDTRLRESERQTAAAENELKLMRETVSTLPASELLPSREHVVSRLDAESAPRALSHERTAYLIGLFGTGRNYLCALVTKNLGTRSSYFRDTIRIHRGPTPMIYSGHSTMKYVSRAQSHPLITRRIFEAVAAGFADLVFIYRHPLDALLTNWIWWRTYLRNGTIISSVSDIYPNRDDLCADLDRNFSEFHAFAEGDPNFFPDPPRFLSFPEFVEETDLYVQSAAALSVRLEDFVVDPVKEFAKLTELISADLDWSSFRPLRPRAKPFGYLAVQSRVPKFAAFIHSLDPDTKDRIENIGYNLGESN